MLRASIVGMMAAAAAMLFATSSAQAQRRVDAGVLLCNMGPSIGALVASRQRIECRYTSRTGNRVEHYSGAITRFGFDLGAVIGGVMSWAFGLEQGVSVVVRWQEITLGSAVRHPWAWVRA